MSVIEKIFTIDNLPWIITTSIAIMAFLSPIVTTLINNRHQIKMKKLEYSHELHKQNIELRISALQNYLLMTSTVIANAKDFIDLTDYAPSYAIATTLIDDDDELLALMKELNDQIMNGNTHDKSKIFEKILPKIKNCIKSIQS